jgi:biotin carboxyl carrier protein
METEIKIGDKTYKVEVGEMEKGIIRVRINDQDYYFSQNKFGELVSVDKKQEQEVSSEESGLLLNGLSENEIRSPIAGVISGIEVKKGDEIKQGQKVVTLIAMKMENEIISEVSGVVKEIKVKKDQFVNGGDVLIFLD